MATLTETAIEAEKEELLRYRWINEGQSTQMAFDEYKVLLMPKKEETAAETLSKIEKMMNNVKGWTEM